MKQKLNLYLDSEIYNMLTERAKELYMNRSEYVTFIVRQASKASGEQVEDLIDDMMKEVIGKFQQKGIIPILTEEEKKAYKVKRKKKK